MFVLHRQERLILSRAHQADNSKRLSHVASAPNSERHLTRRYNIQQVARNAMPVIAIHPGEHLAEELKELGMSAAELARQLDVPTNRITEILNGRRAITGDTALRLAHFFGTTAEFWLNLQSLYEVRLAEQKSGKSIKALPTLKRLQHTQA